MSTPPTLRFRTGDGVPYKAQPDEGFTDVVTAAKWIVARWEDLEVSMEEREFIDCELGLYEDTPDPAIQGSGIKFVCGMDQISPIFL